MPSSRRAYVDWLRGVAVLCMILWHVLDAWTRAPARESLWWPPMQWIGGWAAPLFLFLAGVSVPFAIKSHAARGADPVRAAWLVQRRGWEVVGIAHLFRLQSFLVNPRAQWSSVLAPDILNILGLGLVVTAWLAGRSRTPARAVAWLLLPAIAVVALTPLVPHWWWPTRLPIWLEAYIRPAGGLGIFRLFPSVAFVPLGAFAALHIAAVRDEAGERRVHRRLAVAGAVVAAMGYAMGAIRIPAFVFWTDAWAVPIWQAGVMTLALWASWALLRWTSASRAAGLWEPLLVLGRTSLFVYWVHVELSYGGLSYPLHHALPLGRALVGVVCMTVAMYFAAGWWNNRTSRPWIPELLRAQDVKGVKEVKT